MIISSLTSDSCMVRSTAAWMGRTQAVEPGRTDARHLHCGRVNVHLESGAGGSGLNKGER